MAQENAHIPKIHSTNTVDTEHQRQCDLMIMRSRGDDHKWVISRLYEGGRGKDGGGIGRQDHFLPHKFLKRTFQRRANFTKQLL